MLDEPARDDVTQSKNLRRQLGSQYRKPSQCRNTIFTLIRKSPQWASTCVKAQVSRISPIQKNGYLMAPRPKTNCRRALVQSIEANGHAFRNMD